jgi:hypothetical protein
MHIERSIHVRLTTTEHRLQKPNRERDIIRILKKQPDDSKWLTFLLAGLVTALPFVGTHLLMTDFLGLNRVDPIDSLESLKYDEQYRYKNTAITAKHTFAYNASFCRHFMLAYPATTQEGIACRDPDGTWRVHFTLHHPNSGHESDLARFESNMTSQLSAMADGPMLSHEDVQRLIDHAWPPRIP